MAAVLGSLKILLGLDSAQITSDMGKVRGVVTSGMSDVQARASSAMAAVGSEVQGLGGHLRGAQQATAAAMKGLELMGAKGSAAVGAIGNAISGILAGGFTPLGLALGAVTAGIALFAQTEREAKSAADETAASIQKNVDRLKELKDVRELIARGQQGSPEERSILEAERRLAGLRNELFLASANRITGALPNDQIRDIQKRIREAEQDLTVQREALDIARQNAAARSTAAKSAKAEAAAVAEVVRTAGTGQAPGAESDLQKRVRELRTSISAADLQFDSTRFGVPSEILAQRQRVRDAQNAAQRIITDRRDPRFVALTEEQKLLIERQRLEERYLQTLEREWETSKRIEAQRVTQSDLGRANADAERERGAKSAKLREDQAFQDRVAAMKSDLSFELAQIDRSDVERSVETERRRWEGVLSDARLGADQRVEIEQLLERRLQRIRELSNPQGVTEEQVRAVQERGFRSGFGGTIAELADLQRAGEEAGRGIAFALTDGVGGALMAIAQGAASTGEAFRRLGLDVANMIARMGLQLALSQAFGAGFGIASPAGGVFSTPQAGVPMASAAGAHGGTWRVGGFGGLDSQLVSMRLSPGEMVKVTDGANSGRGGGESPVNVALSIRPPAVIADDVLAKSSREAKAAVVSSAVSRGGRRGQRARD